MSDTRSQGCTDLQSLVKCLDHRGIFVCYTLKLYVQVHCSVATALCDTAGQAFLLFNCYSYGCWLPDGLWYHYDALT